MLSADTNTIEKQCKESDRSSNISDLKLDLRTGSSNSNMHCDMDYIPGAESETGSESVITRIGVPLAGPVNVPGQNVYRYSGDYSEATFPPKVRIDLKIFAMWVLFCFVCVQISFEAYME